MSKKDIESKVLDTNVNKTLANESQSFVQSVDEDNVVEDVANNVCEEVIQPKHKTVMISATSKISAMRSVGSPYPQNTSSVYLVRSRARML